MVFSAKRVCFSFHLTIRAGPWIYLIREAVTTQRLKMSESTSHPVIHGFTGQWRWLAPSHQSPVNLPWHMAGSPGRRIPVSASDKWSDCELDYTLIWHWFESLNGCCFLISFQIQLVHGSSSSTVLRVLEGEVRTKPQVNVPTKPSIVTNCFQ